MDKNLLKFASMVAFGVSGLFTIMLMCSGVVGIIATVLTCLIAIILELSKCSLFYFSIYGKVYGKQINSVIRGVCFVVAMLLFCASIVASLSFMQNNNNKTKNILAGTSQQAQAKTENIKVQKDLVNSKKAEIKGLEGQKENIISSTTSLVNSYKSKNMLTKAKETTENSNKRIETINKQINQANKELTSITNDLKKEQDKEITVTGDTKGYTAFLKVVANKINEGAEYKENPVSVEEIETYFFGILAVIFEIVAVLLFYLNSLAAEKIESGSSFSSLSENEIMAIESDGEPETEEKENIEDGTEKEKPVELKKYRKQKTGTKETIGFKTDKQEEQKKYKRDDVKSYIQFMYSSMNKDNTSQGKDKIRLGTGLKPKQIEGIRYELEQKGIIEIKDRKTFVIDSLEDAMRKI